MGNSKKLSELDLAEAILANDVLLIVQDGVSRRVLAEDVKTFVGSGLPVQSTDLMVPVTSDAEFITALADYWNYNFTAGARYIIQFQTGYTIGIQLALTNQFMPHLVMRSQTTTDVDCSTFAANPLGVKAAFSFSNCRLAAFYGSFTSSNGGTTSPLLLFGTSVDFWNGNILAPVTLNMSGFTATGGSAGFQLYGWEQLTPYFMGTTVTLDTFANINYSNLTGTKFKVGAGTTQFSGCNGDVQLEDTAAVNGGFTFSRSKMTVYWTHASTATWTVTTSLASDVNLVVAGNSFTANTVANTIFDALGATNLQVYFLNTFTWYPQAAGEYFADVYAGATFQACGGNCSIDTSVATPNFFMKVSTGANAQHSFSPSAGFTFPAGAYTFDGSTPVIENAPTEHGFMVMTRHPDSAGGPIKGIFATEAGTDIPDYAGVPALVVSSGVALTTTTIDLTNYAKDGLKVKMMFDPFAIAGITWVGGTFIGAPASVAGDEVFDVIYRASNTTFYFS